MSDYARDAVFRQKLTPAASALIATTISAICRRSSLTTYIPEERPEDDRLLSQTNCRLLLVECLGEARNVAVEPRRSSGCVSVLLAPFRAEL